MGNESYNHLTIETKGYRLPYTGSGGSTKLPPIPRMQDREGHASRLIADLEKVIAAKGRYRDPALDDEQDGYHITARARTWIGVRATGNVPEVLSIKGEGEQQTVNLFIRTVDLDTAKRRLEKYASYDELTSSGNKPAGFPLFESVERFEETTLQDLWTDPASPIPVSSDDASEWEIWIRAGMAERMRSFGGRYGVRFELGQADFPSVSVLRAHATSESLINLVDATSAVLELRACSSLTLQVLDMHNALQRSLASGIATRISPPAADAPVICILDTGVHWNNPLLRQAITEERCYSINDAWDRFGWNEHGTRVAGIALYRDLRGLIERPRDHRLTTGLESVVVLRPTSGPRSALETIGEIVAAVDLVETGEARRRVFCMASSDVRGLNDGTPTKLSGTVDQLAWGHNGEPRLFCVAAGNLRDDPILVSGYASRNEQSGIGSPGQALNAITVGGCTFQDEHPHGGRLLCDAGDLSASSRTSASWIVRRAIKPDMVFEAGNHGRPADVEETASQRLAELDVLTTNASLARPLATLGETSASTAAVAGMAGRLMARYPSYWPETIRALLVHSASWTQAMWARGAEYDDKEKSCEAILALFGWGVPNERTAAGSASDLLTMVVQDEIVPLKEKDGGVVLNECAYHLLPWPVAALRALGNQKVELRITLSYFVQPDMRAPSARNFGDYPSHRFAFDLKGADDDDLDAIRRQNLAFKGARQAVPPHRPEENWRLGPRLRERGTIHHDVWTGSAETLASQDAIRVTPKGGWWAKSPNASYAGVAARYALIASIRTPASSQDIYQEALTVVENPQVQRIAAVQKLVKTVVSVST